MAKRIYVGGLPYSVTEGDLENLFKGSGSVTSATVVSDRYTGQSKGFGFVEMSTDSESDAAIQSLNAVPAPSALVLAVSGALVGVAVRLRRRGRVGG